MANFNSDNAALLALTPPSRVQVNKLHGRVRYLEAQYTVPASGGPQIGDTITWGAVPRGARILGHLSELSWSTGAASSTLNLGDAASAARHLAATAVTTAGQAVPRAASANGLLSFVALDDSIASGAPSATNTTTLRSTVAGAALQAAQTIVLRVAYVLD